MGAVVLGAIGLYLLISIGIVIWAISHARKHNKSKKLWGVGAALVMYLLVFWDHIPTVVAHKYYCSTEAGFWVYKTVDEWKAEHPGVMEALVVNQSGNADLDGYVLNQRFRWATEKTGPMLFNRWRWEHQVLDIKTKEVLARYVDYSTGSGFIGGPPRILKLWLQSDYCDGGLYRYGEFLDIKRDFQGVEK